MEKKTTAPLAQGNQKQLAVAKAQEAADNARLMYDQMPSVVNLLAQREACRDVFKARVSYLIDLDNQVLLQHFKGDTTAPLKMLLGDVPFIITVNMERLTFELTDTATGEVFNGFNAVETFLLNKLK